jgi:hypothetical protein
MEEDTNKSNKKKYTAIIMIVVGIITIVLGSIGITEDESTDAALVDLGVTVTISNTVEEYPESVPYLQKASEVLDTVIAARNGNMEDMKAMLSAELVKITNESTASTATVAAIRILKLVSDAYDKSETEEVLIHKLNIINAAIKDNLEAYKQ